MVHSLQWSAPPGRWSSWVDLTQTDLTWVNLYLARERGPEIQPDWWHCDKQYSAEFWAVSWVCIVVQFPDQFNPASRPFTHSQGRVFIMIKWSNSSNCVREPVQRTQPCGTGRLACERVFIRLRLQSRDPQTDYTYGKYVWPRNLPIKFYMWVCIRLLKSEHNLCVCVRWTPAFWVAFSLHLISSMHFSNFVSNDNHESSLKVAVLFGFICSFLPGSSRTIDKRKFCRNCFFIESILYSKFYVPCGQ